MGHYLFLEVLHDLGSLVPLVLVAAHYGLQQSLPAVLADV